MRAICIEGLLCDHKQVQLDVLNLHSSWAAWSFLKFVRVHRPYVKRLYYGRNRSSRRYFRLSELCKANVFVFLKSDWKFFPKEKKSIQTDNALVLTQTEGSADSVIWEQSSQPASSLQRQNTLFLRHASSPSAQRKRASPPCAFLLGCACLPEWLYPQWRIEH